MGTNNVLRLTDIEIEDMQKQINKEAGIDTDDGGLMFHRIQMVSQDILQQVVVQYPDDLDKYQGTNHPRERRNK